MADEQLEIRKDSSNSVTFDRCGDESTWETEEDFDSAPPEVGRKGAGLLIR